MTTKSYGPQRITLIITQGLLCVAVALAALLLVYDILHGTFLRARFWIACLAVVYLFVAVILARKGHIQPANWLLIILCEMLAAIVLTYWGLTSVTGILAAIFALLLPGVLMMPRAIFPVACMTLGVLILVYCLHATECVIPVAYTPSTASSPLDVIAYATIFGVFALVSWVSARQTTLSLERAHKAEDGLRRQKESLATELAQESSRLRQAQLLQIQQLHRFAVIGQSAAATLHELSNHLSVLNLDISDLKQQHQHSQAIINAEEGIKYINRMVRNTRAQLNAHNETQTFNVLPTVTQAIKDFRLKFKQRHIKFTQTRPKHSPPFLIRGDPLSFMQCISILLNNAVEACSDIPSAHIHLTVTIHETLITVTISDNGPGISPRCRRTLFQPHESTKPTGLGVGLYIAKHLIESRLKGKLKLLDSSSGASFQITLKGARL